MFHTRSHMSQSGVWCKWLAMEINVGDQFQPHLGTTGWRQVFDGKCGQGGMILYTCLYGGWRKFQELTPLEVLNSFAITPIKQFKCAGEETVWFIFLWGTSASLVWPLNVVLAWWQCNEFPLLIISLLLYINPPSCNNAGSSKKKSSRLSNVYDFKIWTFRVMNYLSNKTMSHRSPLKDHRLVVGEVNRRLSHFVNTGKMSSGAGSFPHQVYSANFWGETRHE